MKIRGLLRAFKSVRSQLQAGIKPEDVTVFTNHVKSLVRSVEEICARHGVPPKQLPSPSFRAYLFLKELDTGNLPSHRSDEPGAHTASGLALRGILRLQDDLAERFWRLSGLSNASPSERDQLRVDVQQHAAAIEDICSKHGSSPASLEPPSKRVYYWLKFLSQDENFTLHVKALERARAALIGHQPGVAFPVTLHLLNTDSLCRTRRYRNLLLLKINEGFLNAENGIWEALLKNLLFGSDRTGKAIFREYAESEEFSEVLCEIESLAESTSLFNQGYVHNLEASFARVNAMYFAGQMDQPRLVWNRALTGRKFGHYRRGVDVVMLSVSLDAPAVPECVLDFVMYHELLH
jgi:hypothetical protein